MLDRLSSSVLESFSSTESRGLTTVDGVVLDTGFSISGNDARSVPGSIVVTSAPSFDGIAKVILPAAASSLARLK